MRKVILWEIEIWPFYQMVYAQTRTNPEEWDAQNSLGQTDQRNSTRRPDRVLIDKERKKERKKENLPYSGFGNPGRPQRENQRKRKERQVFRPWQKTKKSMEHKSDGVIGALGKILRCLMRELEKLEIRRRVNTIQTTALLRSARILRRVLETWGDLLLLRLQWKLSRNNVNNN